MECYKCKVQTKYQKNLKFNGFKVEGWKCPKCREEYYPPEQVEPILLLNKLLMKKYNLKLSQVKSNLIIRIPKKISDVMKLQKGDEVELRLKNEKEIVVGKI